MCTITAKRKMTPNRHLRRTLNKTGKVMRNNTEDELDKALFLSSLTPECFEKASQEESAAFEEWLFATDNN